LILKIKFGKCGLRRKKLRVVVGFEPFTDLLKEIMYGKHALKAPSLVSVFFNFKTSPVRGSFSLH
jgi:hypothetical protein